MAIVDIWSIAYDVATDQFDPESRYYGDVSTWLRLYEGTTGENTWTPAEKRETKEYKERQASGEGNPETLRRAYKPSLAGKGLVGSNIASGGAAIAEQSAQADKTLLYVAGGALALVAIAYVARR
jgi:hypothetical protein